MSTCASCGKAGSDLKRCTPCKSVLYCDATCQRDHRPSHKKECKRIEKELRKEGGFRLRVLTKKERREEFERLCEVDPWIGDMANGSDLLYPDHRELTECQPLYKWEGYDTVEEALDHFWDESQRDELQEEIPNWEWRDYSSLEDACMKEYNAKSVEEAIWDGVAVPRIDIIWPAGSTKEEQNEIMKRAGWRWLGYKPKDICPCENGLKRGQRIAGGYGDGWGEQSWSIGSRR